MNEPKWIRFESTPTPAARRTGVWRVLTKTQRLGEISVLLGEVRWWPPWRRYSFFPNVGVCPVFEAACLRDIAAFMDERMDERRRLRAPTAR